MKILWEFAADAPEVMQTLEFLGRILLACILGTLIGYERKNRNKEAGIRTHAIVALGAALIMVISKYGFDEPGMGSADRIAAQVVSGVGFLGAGIIFVRNNEVSGLTTAAGIWATAGIGLALGSGMYVIGVCSALLVIVTQTITHKIPALAREPHRGHLRIAVSPEENGVKKIKERILEENIELIFLKIAKESGQTKIDADVVYPGKCDKVEFLSSLAEEEEVLSVKG